MAFNYAVVAQFVSTKLIPAFNAVMAQLPALLSTDAGDVQAALTAIVKVITDLQTSLTTLVNAVKSAS